MTQESGTGRWGGGGGNETYLEFLGVRPCPHSLQERDGVRIWNSPCAPSPAGQYSSLPTHSPCTLSPAVPLTPSPQPLTPPPWWCPLLPARSPCPPAMLGPLTLDLQPPLPSSEGITSFLFSPSHILG